MEITTTITVPYYIYQLYSEASKILGDHTTEQVMSTALSAYAQHLVEDMLKSGELTDRKNVERPS